MKKYKTIYIITTTFLITIIGILKLKLLDKDKIECKNIKSEKKIYVEKKLSLTKKDNVVLFGDSITELYPVDEIYHDLPVMKSGVSGYKTKNLLDRMDNMLYRYNPTKVFLLIGINDLIDDRSEENQETTINNSLRIAFS